MATEKLYIDEPVVASFFIGEIGWFLQRFQGYLRYLKTQKYKDHKFLLMTDLQLHPLCSDFVAYTIDLPREFKELGLETDCYEAPVAGSPPGSLTPPNVYSALIEYIRKIYNPEKAVEVWAPRGPSALWIDKKPQIFKTYETAPTEHDKPIIVVYPRGRARAPQRNIPEYIWKEVVDKLALSFTVVLAGTPKGSFLADYTGDNVINLISYVGDDKLERIMPYFCNAACSIGSQSGLTHLSLLCRCPSYILGHERRRHAETDNRFTTPVMFRELRDYRAVDAITILTDTTRFLTSLERKGVGKRRLTTQISRPSLALLKDKKDIIGVEIGVQFGDNAENILKNLDIKKLYLVDPYIVYTGLDSSRGYSTQPEIEAAFNYANRILDKYKDKIVWIKELSQDAVQQIEDGIDFVYVDGNHLYDYVFKDVELYYPKLKDGGMIAFHDYGPDSPTNNVVRAVEDYFKDKNVKIITESSLDSVHDPVAEGWIIKPIPFNSLIKNDKNLLNELIKI